MTFEKPYKMMSITFWKVAGWDDIPKRRRVYLYRPQCVLMVTYCQEAIAGRHGRDTILWISYLPPLLQKDPLALTRDAALSPWSLIHCHLIVPTNAQLAIFLGDRDNWSSPITGVDFPEDACCLQSIQFLLNLRLECKRYWSWVVRSSPASA